MEKPDALRDQIEAAIEAVLRLGRPTQITVSPSGHTVILASARAGSGCLHYDTTTSRFVYLGLPLVVMRDQAEPWKVEHDSRYEATLLAHGPVFELSNGPAYFTALDECSDAGRIRRIR